MNELKSMVTYVRSLLGWVDENPAISTSFKRDRSHSSFPYSDDDTPALKRLKQRKSVDEVMVPNDPWEKEENQSKVRYVPIQIESGYPSTSTPIDSKRSRVRAVPIKLVSENGPNTPSRKPRMHTPVRPVVHAVIDDDDDEPEVTLVEHKPQSSKKPQKIYISLDEDENAETDDVIFVKKVTSPPPAKPLKYFISSSNDETDNIVEPIYYKLSRKNYERSNSPKTVSKFKAPPGITKSYKRSPPPVARWLQQKSPKTNFSQARNKYLNTNGNLRSTLAEVFNLNEKKNYQELINKFAGQTRKVTLHKPVSQIINLAEDSASFRETQRSQKNALNELNLLEKGLAAEKENEASKEYSPITVASMTSSDSELEIVPSESSTSSSVRVDPTNSLKESLKDNPLTGSDWLRKLDTKYRKKKHLAQEKLNDVRRESDIISKINYEQNLAHLENKLKYELSIPESLIDEAQAGVELPPLTPEQEKRVSKALGPGPPNQLLVEKFNLRIHRRDLQTLAGLNWLNDEVINFYMNLLMQRSEERKDLPRVYATNTFFYPKLMQSGQAGLRRWTRKVDIFGHDIMVVPVHLGVHWCVSLVDFRSKKINYLDSMGSPNRACLAALLQYLKDEHQDKKGQPFDDSGWKTECLKDIPQQMNGSDCGMFACTFAEFTCRDAPYTFTQAHMPYLRRKAALEILQGRLLL